MISLSSPLANSPQNFNQEIDSIQNFLINNLSSLNKTLNLNFFGGWRDFLVPPFLGDITVQGRKKYSVAHQIVVNTEEMRNVKQSMDHNSPYYYKYFLDSFVPVVIKMIILGKNHDTSERLTIARALLIGNTD